MKKLTRQSKKLLRRHVFSVRCVRCTVLETLLLDYNQLAPTEEDVARFRRIYLFSCIYLAIPPYQ